MPKAPKPINDTTFGVELLGKDKVEIGDKESIDFKPSIKLNRWDGECFIKVSLPTTEKPKAIIEGDKVKFGGKDIEAVFYPLEPTTVIAKDKDGNDVEFTQNELGGFEFEVILKKKPTSNKIVLNIESQELKFFYQSELTPEEIAEGVVRPDNVVGSYAVYHATKRDHIVGQTNYMCGKAFHIYRPKITDAEGKWVWGELNLDERAGTLTITIGQDWLEGAVYPVSVDPNFGYESKGAANTNIRDGIQASYYEIPVAGTAQSITIWAYWTDDSKVKCAIYTYVADDEAGSLVKATVERDELSGHGWSGDYYTTTFNFGDPKPELTATTKYFLAAWSEAWVRLYFDTTGGHNVSDADITYTGSFPETFANDASDVWKFSIYCTYEVVSAEQELTASPLSIASSIQASAIAGSGIAPLTPSPLTVASSIQQAALTAEGEAPLTASPVAVTASVQAAAVITSIQYLAAAPVVAASSVSAASVAGTSEAPLTASPIAVASSIRATSIAGSGIAPLTQAVVSIASSVVSAQITTTQELAASPVSVASSVQSASISGVGIGELTAATIAVVASIQNSALAAIGAATLASAPILVTSSIVAAAIAGTGTAPLAALPITVISSIQVAQMERLSRLLKVMAITSQYRNLNVITTQNRRSNIITTQNRRGEIITGV